jgi:predicted secreted protein
MTSVAGAWAGDVASFVNLGFSPDSRVFMFGQYGLDVDGAKPFAELYVVNVPSNTFEPDGVKKRTFDVQLYPGQDGSGALYTMLEDNVGLIRKYHIDHLIPGRIVYLLVDGQQPKSHIEFRDFNTGNSYAVDLIQRAQTVGKPVGASYHIILTARLKDGTSRTLTVGLPGYVREGVTSYRIRQIILSPDGKSLIFIVDKEYKSDTGKTIRYMVETATIK